MDIAFSIRALLRALLTSLYWIHVLLGTSNIDGSSHDEPGFLVAVCCVYLLFPAMV